MTEIGEGCKDKLFLSGQRRLAYEKDELTWFQTIALPPTTSTFFSFLIFFFFFVHKASKRWWEELVEKSFSFLLGLFLTKEDRTALMMSFSSTPSPAILLLLFDSCQKSTPNSSSHQNANKQILMHQRITHMYCQILTIPFVQLELQEHTPVQIWSLTT